MCVFSKRRYEEWNCIFLKENFGLEFVVYGWEKIRDRLIQIQKGMEGLWKRNLRKEFVDIKVSNKFN